MGVIIVPSTYAYLCQLPLLHCLLILGPKIFTPQSDSPFMSYLLLGLSLPSAFPPRTVGECLELCHSSSPAPQCQGWASSAPWPAWGNQASLYQVQLRGRLGFWSSFPSLFWEPDFCVPVPANYYAIVTDLDGRFQSLPLSPVWLILGSGNFSLFLYWTSHDFCVCKAYTQCASTSDS